MLMTLVLTLGYTVYSITGIFRFNLEYNCLLERLCVGGHSELSSLVRMFMLYPFMATLYLSISFLSHFLLKLSA